MLKYSKFISGILGALSSVIFKILFDIFTVNFPNWISLFFSVGLTVIVDIGILFLFKLLIKISYALPFFRKKLSSFAAAEGTWIEYVENPSSRAISIAKIKYHPLNFKFQYSGEAYDVNGNLQATWNCETFLSENERVFNFFGSGKYLFEDKDVKTAGYINFYDNDFTYSKNFIRGKGAYYDYNVKLDEYEKSEATNIFIMERYETICQKYIMKDKPQNNEEFQKVILGYYKDNCNFNSQLSKTELNI